MADDNSATDAESPADRQHAFTELSELLIKGSAVLAIAGFLFTQARTAIDQGGAWIAMGLTMTLATILVAVLGVATFSGVIARFVSLILSDPGDSLFKRLVARHGTWFLAFLIACTAFGLAKNLGVIV